MEVFLKVLLVLHIICGFASLVSGCIAILTRKGSRVHRGAGKVFFYNMLGVSITAVGISFSRWNSFLLMIGIFAFFQNYSGYRSVKNKSLKPTKADRVVLLMAAINSVFMLLSMKPVLMVFGLISTLLIAGDIKTFIKTSRNEQLNKNQWLIRHIGMMLGTYIATFTAFLVVNVRHFEPAWLPWLLPTFVFTPLIAYWTRRYSVKPKTAAK